MKLKKYSNLKIANKSIERFNDLKLNDKILDYILTKKTGISCMMTQKQVQHVKR